MMIFNYTLNTNNNNHKVLYIHLDQDYIFFKQVYTNKERDPCTISDKSVPKEFTHRHKNKIR